MTEASQTIASVSREIVGLSISEPNDGLQHGFGTEHLSELWVRLARSLLRSGAYLGYGGDLRRRGYTETLFNVVRAERAELVAEKSDKDSRARQMVSYLAWPGYHKLSIDLRADLINLCRFVFVPPPGVEVAPLDHPSPALESIDEILDSSLALSRMRRAMVQGYPTDSNGHTVPPQRVRMVLGGKTNGWSGLAPGIPEEVAWALRENRSTKTRKVAVYILGGFGGAAHVVAAGILRGKLTDDQSQILYSEYKAAAQPGDPLSASLARLEERIAADKSSAKELAELHPKHHGASLTDAFGEGPDVLCNGLDADENRALMECEDVTQALRWVLKGLRALPARERGRRGAKKKRSRGSRKSRRS